jgi:hypothetical protein
LGGGARDKSTKSKKAKVKRQKFKKKSESFALSTPLASPQKPLIQKDESKIL